jgi:hypothetical protein
VALTLSLYDTFVAVSFYINLSYIVKLERLSLSIQEKYMAALVASLGLSLLLLLITQFWADYRGFRNAIRSVFGGPVITLLGCVSIIFANLEQALSQARSKALRVYAANTLPTRCAFYP